MLKTLLELLVGPLLVGGSTWTARRWGPRAGGLVSVFPAVVGPVLFITASQRGVVSAGQAANGTLLGLVGLSGFVLTYAWVARRAPWTVSVLAGWACAGVLALSVGWLSADAAFPAGLAAAVTALLLARLAMPPCELQPARVPDGRTSIPARMLATAVLVALLSTAAVVLGPVLGGLLAGLPILASVLAVGTHRREGPEVVIALLRGMLGGMAGFAAFCAVVAWLIVPAGIAAAFAAATAVAVALQLGALAHGYWPIVLAQPQTDR